MALLWLTACARTWICGPETVDVGGVCTVAAESAPAKDSGTAGLDSGADSGADSAGPIVRDVYILAGQSNMDGYAYLSGLPESWLVADDRVPMYWSGWGEFRGLQPASAGGNFYVGPEVSFGRALADAGHVVALVKHAVGGTDLAAYWYPGKHAGDAAAGPGFTDLIDAMGAARHALDASGEDWRWAGFVWMQGESDALDSVMASAYEANLTRLVAAMRTVTGEPELLGIIGLISREAVWTYADAVRDAQQAVAAADANVVAVETDDLARNPDDAAHYDGPSERAMGLRFAQAARTSHDVPAGSDAPVAAMTVTTWRTDYDFTGTCGWSFSLDRAVIVTDVGAFGPGVYLGTSADIGIWNVAGELVARSSVPAWVEAPASYRGGFWYRAIDPVELAVGTYRIGLVSWSGDADRYGNDAAGGMTGGFAFGEPVYAEGYWLTYPANTAATPGMSFIGPNLLTVAAGD